MTDLSKLAHSEEATIVPKDIPDEIKAFVDAAHRYWKEFPKKWRQVVIGTEEDIKEVKKLAAKWAKATGRTFRENKNRPDGTLIYKVMDGVRGNAPAEGKPADSEKPASETKTKGSK